MRGSLNSTRQHYSAGMCVFAERRLREGQKIGVETDQWRIRPINNSFRFFNRQMLPYLQVPDAPPAEDCWQVNNLHKGPGYYLRCDIYK